ncbi:hypothetical protein EXN66_Car019333 [Channa argus]|uniref:Uncharacterized protein n=1 Tax=Channa argus TaxID=215402 RepID=A0A6G1QM70_CHAAH|nr:hypothetical protein EXN66_Car019333 [Channa argus]
MKQQGMHRRTLTLPAPHRHEAALYQPAVKIYTGCQPTERWDDALTVGFLWALLKATTGIKVSLVAEVKKDAEDDDDDDDEVDSQPSERHQSSPVKAVTAGLRFQALPGKNTKSNRRRSAPEAYQETSRQLYLDVAFCLSNQKHEGRQKKSEKAENLKRRRSKRDYVKQFHLCLTTVKIAYTPVKKLECIQEANDRACGRSGRLLWDSLIGRTPQTVGAQEETRNHTDINAGSKRDTSSSGIFLIATENARLHTSDCVAPTSINLIDLEPC